MPFLLIYLHIYKYDHIVRTYIYIITASTTVSKSIFILTVPT